MYLLFSKKKVVAILRNGLKVKVRDLMELWTVKETILEDCYGISKLEKDFGSKSSLVMIDIGGALGDLSLYFKKLYPQAKIFVFEPQSESIDLIKENIQLNNIDVADVEISNSAVSNFLAEPQYKGFVLASDQKNGEKNFDEISDKERVEGKEYTEIPFTNLNFFLKKLSAPVDLLKLDCEGGEYNILPLMTKEALSKVNHIAMEWHVFNSKHKVQDITEHLKNNGFAIRVKKSPVHNELGYLFASR